MSCLRQKGIVVILDRHSFLVLLVCGNLVFSKITLSFMQQVH